jgi:branched-chain amino acid transport system ATP-binding protein
VSAPILEVAGLEKRFGGLVAARDINVALAEGEVVGVIGANGAGKTTFVNMVTGYLKPTAGTIRFRGRDITHMPPREVTRIGICRSFQVPQVFGSLTVLENVMVALGIADPEGLSWWRPLERSERTARARALLDRYGIGDAAGREVRLLPQGVRKLLDVAMATVSGPQILMLDEPTSGISVEEKYDVMERLMTALRAERTTVLFVEHDMEVVARYAGRVLAFYDGRVIADGPPDAVLVDAEVRRYVVGEQRARPAA